MEEENLVENETKSATLCQAICVPGVLSFGAAFFFTKFAVYSIALWLPSFLENALDYTPRKAANVASSDSVGNFIGGFLL